MNHLSQFHGEAAVYNQMMTLYQLIHDHVQAPHNTKRLTSSFHKMWIYICAVLGSCLNVVPRLLSQFSIISGWCLNISLIIWNDITLSSLLNCVPCGQKTCQCALRAHVPTCLACLHAHVPMCFAWLHSYVLMCLSCSRTNVPCILTCLRATCLACLCAHVLVHAYVFTCFACFRAHVPTC